MTDIKIEAGKCYRTRDGQKVGPMCHPEPESLFGWNVLGNRRGRWKHDGVDGEAAGHVKNAPGDLVAEWTDAPDLTAKPDYNDGKWHGWNGGECPVPGALGYITYADGFKAAEGCEVTLDVFRWGEPLMFRVTKPVPPKPREWWLVKSFAPFESREVAQKWARDEHPVIHVREVLPE